ncbi:MAG: hypothetical protein RIQ52_495 [Pseudomonadota bacterium]|jgi:TetR/AcrR family transcriptional repressor of mexJK operon
MVESSSMDRVVREMGIVIHKVKLNGLVYDRSCTVIEESLALYRLLIAGQQNFPELGRRVYASTAVPIIDRISSYLQQLHQQGLIDLPDGRASSELLMGTLQGVQHFRCLMGLQASLAWLEREQLVESALQLFWKGHQCK